MPLNLTGHLPNAVLLFVAALVALAADRLAAAPAGSAPQLGAQADVAAFVTPLPADARVSGYAPTIPVDPFDRERPLFVESGVASAPAVPTVPSASARGRRLTAILVADERRVAVIDDATVTIGDVLRDGARVSAIQPDRVWVVEKDGRWRMLTLTARGQ
jgi:hypothetical protein